MSCIQLHTAPSNDISAFVAISLYRITDEYSLREKCVWGPGARDVVP